MSFPKKKPSSSSWNVSSDSPSAKRPLQRVLAIRATRSPGRQYTIFNPLLNIPIGRRLTLGFLIPALFAALILTSVGTQNQQRLTQEATFCQHLLNAYTSLTEEADSMQQMQIDLSRVAAYAAQPHPIIQILKDDQGTIQGLATQVNTTLVAYYKQDLIKDSPDLVALFTEAGHGTQIEQQLTYSEGVLQSWQAYYSIQAQVLGMITTEYSSTQTQTPDLFITKHLTPAQILILTQANTAFTDVMRDLQALTSFNGNLGNSLQDAAKVETQRLLGSTILAVLGILLGIGLVGLLISSTLVQRLQRLRSVVQAIASGQVDARLDVRGHDEITDVSRATNVMLDTLVGLLEETKRQRDELSGAQELQRLHQQLQQEHEALNTANTRLAALATMDPLTELPNHRTIMNHIEEELVRCQQTHYLCAILFLDIDHFKNINDTWGHRAGDEILCEVGRRLVDTVRQEDFVGRYGGEEFAIVLTNTGLEEASEVAERLREALDKDPCLWETGEAQPAIAIQITGSFGISVYQEHGTTRETLIEAADGAMYQAKHSGRNRVCIAGDEFSSVQNELATSSDPQIQETLVVQALVAVANAHDVGTSDHAIRMMRMVEATAYELGRPEEEVQLIRVAALLHDIGKIGIPDHILNKPGPLTDEEWSVMRHHPKIGHQILTQVGEKFESVSHIIVAHHERWDGHGYPYGLSENMIPLGARILAVADSYDAMTSDRPYRAALPEAEAQAELRSCAGHQFDPRVVEAFIQVLEKQKQDTHFLSLQSV
jgi:diguanylate cyclase (GGDEF)-like protein/putative nucleotidyltransferase with HDIG domain